MSFLANLFKEIFFKIAYPIIEIIVYVVNII
jgi:hypothetical protein